MTYIILIVLAVFAIYAIATRSKISGNSTPDFDDSRFQQAGVEVEFKTGVLRIKNHTYNVNQVTGIRAEPYGRTAFGKQNDREWKAVIEVDDLEKPTHDMTFSSREKANEFTQRLCVALRKAGGPSFN